MGARGHAGKEDGAVSYAGERHDVNYQADARDFRGPCVPIIRKRTRDLSGRLPVYERIDDSEPRLVLWAASQQ